MRADEEAVRRRWASLVAAGRPCPHGAPEGQCVPCQRLAVHPNWGQPPKPWCPQGHLKDKWNGTQLRCSACHREAVRRYKERKALAQ